MEFALRVQGNAFLTVSTEALTGTCYRKFVVKQKTVVLEE